MKFGGWVDEPEDLPADLGEDDFGLEFLMRDANLNGQVKRYVWIENHYRVFLYPAKAIQL